MPINTEGRLLLSEVLSRQVDTDWPVANTNFDLFVQDLTASGNLIANGLIIRNIEVSDNILTGNVTAATITANTLTLDIITANIFVGIDTDQVTEGSNLYFTNTRAVLALTGQNVNVNDLIVDGDLTVQGNTVTLNTHTLVIEDKNIILANGAANALIADGAGISVDGAQANITYLASGDKFVFNKAADFQGNITANTFATSGTGVPTLNSATSIRLNANSAVGGAVIIQNSPLRIRGYSEADIANIIASTGDMVFNTSNSKLMIYNGSDWVDNSLTGVVATTSVSDRYDIRINNQQSYLVTDALDAALTLSGDVDYRYLLHSFVITNISSNDTYVNIDLEYSGNTYRYANSLSIPYGYSVDLIDSPEILNPDTVVKIQALNNSYQASNNTLSSYITYRSALDPSYNLESSLIDQSDTYKTIFVSSNDDSVVDHVRVSNYTANNLRGTLILTDSGDNLKTYVAANTLLAARYYSELLINPIRMTQGDKLKFINFSAEANCMTTFVSYRNVTVPDVTSEELFNEFLLAGM